MFILKLLIDVFNNVILLFIFVLIFVEFVNKLLTEEFKLLTEEFKLLILLFRSMLRLSLDDDDKIFTDVFNIAILSFILPIVELKVSTVELISFTVLFNVLKSELTRFADKFNCSN
jgi:hypothetical protein